MRIHITTIRPARNSSDCRKTIPTIGFIRLEKKPRIVYDLNSWMGYRVKHMAMLNLTSCRQLTLSILPSTSYVPTSLRTSSPTSSGSLAPSGSLHLCMQKLWVFKVLLLDEAWIRSGGQFHNQHVLILQVVRVLVLAHYILCGISKSSSLFTMDISVLMIGPVWITCRIG